MKQQHNPEVSGGAAPHSSTPRGQQDTSLPPAASPSSPCLLQIKRRGPGRGAIWERSPGAWQLCPGAINAPPQSSRGCWSGGTAPSAAPSLPALPLCSASPQPSPSQIIRMNSQMMVGWGWLFSGCFSRLTPPREGAQSPPVGAQPLQRLCPAPSLCLSRTRRHHGGVSKIYFTQQGGGKQGRKNSQSPRRIYS